MERFLWRFYWDWGRSGELEGLFVATENEIQGLAGKSAYFGEVLGKHSEVYGTLEQGDFAKINLDSETVEKVVEVLGVSWSGFDPRHYLGEEDADDN
ncbi:hypothetical protein P4V86_15460 [Brevibacillus laterosporus]|uniref:hypothetical protein n=1 Tax=Brevibacillus laterosporus TaxID=1465 RepID=UPI000369839B|nr:hypothetical protein [Brevibacillus laterosporus]ATO50997.1 hypothetical protein BrL25_18990 [Brevibacillus laterosporus DSM 25]MED2004743.1 hypothetical protein [Brevibacillus laterosporus]